MVTILCIKTSSNGKSSSYSKRIGDTLVLHCALCKRNLYSSCTRQNKAELVTSLNKMKMHWKTLIFKTIYSLGFHISQKVVEISDILHIIVTEERDVISFDNSTSSLQRRKRRHFIRQLKRCVFQTDYTWIQFDYNFILNERKTEFQLEKETKWLDRFPKQLFTRATGILLAAA